VAAGTLVQTIPCVAKTSDRVAKFLPVTRSICACEGRPTATASNASINGRISRIPNIKALGPKSALEFCASGYISLPHPMKISTDDQRAIGVIMVAIGVLCFLIGLAGHLKENYHFRGEISATGFTVAAILAGIGIILFLFSLRKKRG
jgi:hypothetical protein